MEAGPWHRPDDTAPPATGAGETTDSDSGTCNHGRYRQRRCSDRHAGHQHAGCRRGGPDNDRTLDTTTSRHYDDATRRYHGHHAPSETTTPIDLTQLHPYDGEPTIMFEGAPAADAVGGTLVNQNGEKIADQ